MNRCRGCQAKIIWVETPKGRRMCVNAEATLKRNGFRVTERPDRSPIAHYVEAPAVGELLHKSHFADCPAASLFRLKVG